MSAQHYCDKCRKTMADDNFYTYRDGNKTELCKGCMTMHINNWEPETYLWLLEKMDVPYVEAEWNSLRDKAIARNPKRPLTGMSVYGKYLSKMKLKQWKDYRWADTEKLKAEAEEKAKLYGTPEKKEIDYKELYQNGEISENQYKTYSQTMAPNPGDYAPQNQTQQPGAYGIVNDPGYEEVDIDLGNELTQEDKLYLAMKWGRLYKPDEWVKLEQFYEEMCQTFTIEGAARIDTLKLICKTSLKMNQAIDCGDVDAYQKLSRVYDSMMKSAKFTEAQNKEGLQKDWDSVGELVALCEKKGGFIPRFCTDIPQDKVDKTLEDMKGYTYKLVTQDMGLGQRIEEALKKIQIQREMDEDELENEGNIEERTVLEDAHVSQYYDAIEEGKEKDFTILYGEEEEE